MSNFDTLMTEIRDLRRQVTDDFQFNALAMKGLAEDTTAKFKIITDTIQDLSANFSERMNQVEGRLRLQEQRFNRMLEAVEEVILDTRDNSATRADLEEAGARSIARGRIYRETITNAI